MKTTPLLVGIVAYFAAAGCALTSKADLVEVRYFSPEVVRPRATSGAALAPNDAVEVRLGRVSSGPNLRERIAYRDSAYEFGYYNDKRWTERPETFVRRELGRALYEAYGFRRVFSTGAPTIEVDVLAFDDLRLPTGRAARVQLQVLLFDGSVVLYEDTVTVDRPVSAHEPQIEDVVAALASALDIAAEQIAARVGAEILRYRTVPVTAAP